jgi:hypothetical protein
MAESTRIALPGSKGGMPFPNDAIPAKAGIHWG